MSPVHPVDRVTRHAVSECTWQAGFEAGIIVTAVLFSRDA